MADPETLRHAARRLFDAAVAAADPALALRRQLTATPFPRPDPGGRTILIAVGKAAPAMMTEALRHAEGPTEAIVVTQHGNSADVPGAQVFRAGHPVPDQVGLTAARAVIAALDAAGAEDRVIALISGGGSALLPAPSPGLTLQDKAEVNRLLLSSGLDIELMNLVRQQLSDLKGGGMARRAAPAPVAAFILSDVIGDDLRAVASGPTVGPIGTAAQAADVLRDAGLWDRVPDAVRRHLSRHGAPGPVPSADNHLIGSNGHSLNAMLDAAAGQGLDARIIVPPLVGDVEAAADRVLAAGAVIRPGPATLALLFGGETTVKLRGRGLGGRNQELALRVAMGAATAGLPGGWVFLSGGTDGRDGPTDAAGGIVDAGTPGRIRAAGRDAAELLEDNDSHAALKAAGDLLLTGATGTNVADVQVLLIPAAPAAA